MIAFAAGQLTLTRSDFYADIGAGYARGPMNFEAFGRVACALTSAEYRAGQVTEFLIMKYRDRFARRRFLQGVGGALAVPALAGGLARGALAATRKHVNDVRASLRIACDILGTGGNGDRGGPRRRDGKLPATFEVVYGHAWKPQPRVTPDGKPIIPLKPLR